MEQRGSEIELFSGGFSYFKSPFFFIIFNLKLNNMANLTISLSHDCNELVLGSNKHFDKLYHEFENKWESIISLFEDKFLVNNHVIADSSGVEIYTSNFSTLDDGKTKL